MLFVKRSWTVWDKGLNRNSETAEELDIDDIANAVENEVLKDADVIVVHNDKNRNIRNLFR